MDLLLPGMRVAAGKMAVTPDSKTGNITGDCDPVLMRSTPKATTSGIPANPVPALAHQQFDINYLEGNYRNPIVLQTAA